MMCIIFVDLQREKACTLAQRISHCYLPANSFVLSVLPVVSLGNCELHLAKGQSRCLTRDLLMFHLTTGRL
uniref:Uncharacterized protein n=1 Tax=Anguilla anguilla TaxID=7936 RepID=A0A0E9RI32_ANGAN